MKVHATETVIIGGGQAGLSLARHLEAARRSYVVLERGRVGERWRAERWDSLRLLTGNWLNQLDGGAPHRDPDGFLRRAEFARYLRRYGRWLQVREHVEVVAVDPLLDGFRVVTDAGEWGASNVVIATGDANTPRLPGIVAPLSLRQLHSSAYRNPAQLPPGGVLVVGAGPSGQQIAAELRRSGRDVVLAVGRHTRTLRSYRGLDILRWLDALGDLEQLIDDCRDPVAATRAANLTLSGAYSGEQLDLDVLQRLGVRIAGRLERFERGRAVFGDGLNDELAAADRRLRRLLRRIDDLPARFWRREAESAAPVEVLDAPSSLDLAAQRISTVIWATGYRRDYSWLNAPALDAGGELVHRHGITTVPGLAVLGLKFQRRRASHFIGRVGADARFLARWIAQPELGRAAGAASPVTS